MHQILHFYLCFVKTVSEVDTYLFFSFQGLSEEEKEKVIKIINKVQEVPNTLTALEKVMM